MTNQMMGSLTLEFHLEAGHFLEGMNWLSSTGEGKSGPDRSEGCHGNLKRECCEGIFQSEGDWRSVYSGSSGLVTNGFHSWFRPGQEISFGWENENSYHNNVAIGHVLRNECDLYLSNEVVHSMLSVSRIFSLISKYFKTRASCWWGEGSVNTLPPLNVMSCNLFSSRPVDVASS